jgi:hypothetical protein
MIEKAHLMDGDGRPMRPVVPPDRRRTGLAAINRDPVGHPMTADRFRKKAQGGVSTSLLREEKVNGLAGLVHRTIEIALLSLHLDVGILH